MRRTILILLVAPVLAGGACSSSGGNKPAVSTSTTHRMTYEECQKSAEYPGFTDASGTKYSGGRYAVEYDNGVCRVQKP